MIRNYVSNDHIESIGEIAKSQSAIIQALSLDNSKLEREIERLNNIINELEKDLIEYFKKEYPDRKLEDYNLENCTYDYALVILGRLQELEESNNN